MPVVGLAGVGPTLRSKGRNRMGRVEASAALLTGTQQKHAVGAVIRSVFRFSHSLDGLGVYIWLSSIPRPMLRICGFTMAALPHGLSAGVAR